MSKILIANWKSNKNIKEAQQWLAQFSPEFTRKAALRPFDWHVVIAPPFPLLETVSSYLDQKKSLPWSVGVQDLSPFAAGSYTGAVSVANLVGLNVQYAILGHSERRKYFAEDSRLIAKKVELCLDGGMTPVVCVDAKEVENQADLLRGIERKKYIIAYEPVEFIGGTISQPTDDIRRVLDQIEDEFGHGQVLYGGSVNPDNVDELLSVEGIDGFLVGGASLDPEAFVDLLR